MILIILTYQKVNENPSYKIVFVKSVKITLIAIGFVKIKNKFNIMSFKP